jgi:hypothetical protein
MYVVCMRVNVSNMSYMLTHPTIMQNYRVVWLLRDATSFRRPILAEDMYTGRAGQTWAFTSEVPNVRVPVDYVTFRMRDILGL